MRREDNLTQILSGILFARMRDRVSPIPVGQYAGGGLNC